MRNKQKTNPMLFRAFGYMFMLFGLLAGVLGFGGSVRAASLLSKVDFEQELNDPYDFVFFENPGTVTGYVPGHTGSL